MKRKIDLHRVGKYSVNRWSKEKNAFEQKLVLLEMDYTGVAEHLGWRAWDSKSKKSTFMHGLIRVTQAVILLAALIAPAMAYDTSKNPDKVPSFGLDIWKGQVAGIDRKLAETNGGTVGGHFDFREPVTNALTVHAFAETEGMNNNLRYSDGYKVGFGLRVFLQD